MQNKLLDYYKELPAWAKGVVVIGGITIIYFTTKQFISRIKKQGKLAKVNQEIIEQKNELKNLEQTGLRASFPDSQYKSWADAIENEFDGCDPFGTSPTYLNKILKQLKNDVDFLKLQTAWGNNRKYDKCGLWNGDIENKSLTYCVKDELDNGQIEDANKILASKGISYRF
jgi:hypothetical protein